MKFTLKASIENPEDLAQFIKDMHIEIDMPFLNNSSDQTVQELCEKVCVSDEFIKALKTKIEGLEQDNKLLLDDIKNLTDSYPGYPKKPEPEQPDQAPMIVSSNSTVLECKVCGRPVPKSKKAPFCSPKCYAKEYAKTHVSKKVKSPLSKSD